MRYENLTHLRYEVGVRASAFSSLLDYCALNIQLEWNGMDRICTRFVAELIGQDFLYDVP